MTAEQRLKDERGGEPDGRGQALGGGPGRGASQPGVWGGAVGGAWAQGRYPGMPVLAGA